ncbi:MAG: hypothetical protein ACRCU2_16745 [Planktothrix sp.]
MSHFITKATLLLASGVFALWLGGVEYPNQPLSHGIGTIAFVNQAAMLLQNLEKEEKPKEEKSLKG